MYFNEDSFHACVLKLFTEFSGDRNSLLDEGHAGRLLSAVVPDMCCSYKKKMFDQNRRTYKLTKTELTEASVHKIMI